MDHVFLTGPLGTQIDIGSWIDKTQGVDWGAHDLVRQQLNQTTFVEGAAFAYETAAGARRMAFPLRVPSGGVAGLSLNAIEASLRQMARPGGYIDIQPDGTPTAEMVRFDLVGGDVAHHQYTVDLQRVGRRELTLSLQTQPFGYWPTWILLASVASVAMTGGGVVPLTAPIGDAPALAEIRIMPTAATFIGSEINVVDGVAFSFAGRPSFTAGLGGGSWQPFSFTGSYSGDTAPRGVSATYIAVALPPSSAGFALCFYYNIPSAVEPAYRGRFRAFAKIGPSAVRPSRLILDAQAESLPANGIISWPIATGNVVGTSPASAIGVGWSIVDLGEITLPLRASGIQQSNYLRLWADTPSWGATTSLSLNGLYMLPVDNDSAVIVPRGVAVGGGYQAGLVPINGPSVSPAGVLVRRDLGALSVIGSNIVGDLNMFRRGRPPVIGATVGQLDLAAWDRKVGASGGDLRSVNSPYAQVAVRYQPRFQFLKGF